jgi:hypothetical protein
MQFRLPLQRSKNPEAIPLSKASEYGPRLLFRNLLQRKHWAATFSRITLPYQAVNQPWRETAPHEIVYQYTG